MLDEVQHRIHLYRTLKGVYKHANPYYSEDVVREVLAFRLKSAEVETPLLLSLVGCMLVFPTSLMLPVALSGAFAATPTVLIIGTFMLGLILISPYWFKYRAGLEKKWLDKGVEFSVYLPSEVGRAWTDWQESLETCRRLDPTGEAYTALKLQDPVLRAALYDYVNKKDLSEAQRTAFIGWFHRTCAEAYDLARTEKARSEAAVVKSELAQDESFAIEAALQSPKEITAARERSSILTNNVQRALSDSDTHERA